MDFRHQHAIITGGSSGISKATAKMVNYFGTLYSIKAALPAMETQKQGHIVLIFSGAGLIGLLGYSSYRPTKFAVRGLAESLRAELKPKNINISIVYPPDTDTPIPQREQDKAY